MDADCRGDCAAGLDATWYGCRNARRSSGTPMLWVIPQMLDDRSQNFEKLKMTVPLQHEMTVRCLLPCFQPESWQNHSLSGQQAMRHDFAGVISSTTHPCYRSWLSPHSYAEHWLLHAHDDAKKNSDIHWSSLNLPVQPVYKSLRRRLLLHSLDTYRFGGAQSLILTISFSGNLYLS
jgi:hypothetical protein